MLTLCPFFPDPPCQGGEGAREADQGGDGRQACADQGGSRAQAGEAGGQEERVAGRAGGVQVDCWRDIIILFHVKQKKWTARGFSFSAAFAFGVMGWASFSLDQSQINGQRFLSGFDMPPAYIHHRVGGTWLSGENGAPGCFCIPFFLRGKGRMASFYLERPPALHACMAFKGKSMGVWASSRMSRRDRTARNELLPRWLIRPDPGQRPRISKQIIPSVLHSSSPVADKSKQVNYLGIWEGKNKETKRLERKTAPSPGINQALGQSFSHCP
jgi:hypothetical protein